jgi:helicase MOV-10
VSDKHFTYLFVDEAGHTTEADLMVALQSAPNVKHMMLAGDHKQLGAVVRAPPSITAHMHVSPLERLQNDPLMKDQVVMLTDNYRSHPAIVNIVNVMYNDKLVAAAPVDPVFHHPSLKLCVHQGCSVQLKVSNDCPVVFLHHKSPETREADSPSWCNVNEAHMLISVAFDLHDRHGVLFSDIAIISPYRKQVQKISGILHAHSERERSPGVKQINVSTVELFQGRESRVVLLSCVRNCSVETVETDVQFSIGFLKQPLRANVALSRAKSLLVIAGNAGLMGVCKTWRTYLERIMAPPLPCMFDVTCSPVQELRSIPKQDMRCGTLVAALDAIDSAQEERPFVRLE